MQIPTTTGFLCRDCTLTQLLETHLTSASELLLMPFLDGANSRQCTMTMKYLDACMGGALALPLKTEQVSAASNFALIERGINLQHCAPGYLYTSAQVGVHVSLEGISFFLLYKTQCYRKLPAASVLGLQSFCGL